MSITVFELISDFFHLLKKFLQHCVICFCLLAFNKNPTQVKLKLNKKLRKKELNHQRKSKGKSKFFNECLLLDQERQLQSERFL